MYRNTKSMNSVLAVETVGFPSDLRTKCQRWWRDGISLLCISISMLIAFFYVKLHKINETWRRKVFCFRRAVSLGQQQTLDSSHTRRTLKWQRQHILATSIFQDSHDMALVLWLTPLKYYFAILSDAQRVYNEREGRMSQWWMTFGGGVWYIIIYILMHSLAYLQCFSNETRKKWCSEKIKAKKLVEQLCISHRKQWAACLWKTES